MKHRSTIAPGTRPTCCGRHALESCSHGVDETLAHGNRAFNPRRTVGDRASNVKHLSTQRTLGPGDVARHAGEA